MNTNTSAPDQSSIRKAKIFITTASLAIPILVTLLHFLPKVAVGDGGARELLNKLPLLNAIINGTTFFILIAALIAVKRKNYQLHRGLMTTSLALSLVFLLSYVTYHATTNHTTFPSDNPLTTLYLFVLNSHILLSALVVPLVLITYYRGMASIFDRHRKIAKITLPIWLYVALTGVIVYLMISPFYPF